MLDMADLLNILANGVIFSTLRHTDPQTVRGRPTLNPRVMSVYFETARSANSK